ncbi:MAG: ATP-dependent helicase, partial [Planctomycetota bacterium]
MDDRRYEQLTASQRQAVFHVEGPLLIIAGPGSGKTRVITYRIAALIDSGVRPHNICAITFTNRAADEMRQRAIGLGASAGAHISTFHSLCVRILRRYASAANVKSNFSIYDEADQRRCIKQALKKCELDATNFPPARMREAISALKNDLMDVEGFQDQAEGFFERTLAKVYAQYQRILSENNALDFDDLLMETALLLQRSPEVRGELGDRFKFLLVDEYQDTNHAQYRIARDLASGHNNICVTGDPDQSIYAWRGADIRNILAFEEDWPDAAVVKLEENFRSTANILKTADCLIAYNQKRKAKKLVPTRPDGEDVRLTLLEDEVQEAETIAEHIKELTDHGVSLKDVAVFYRVNAMSRVLEESFMRNNIPYQIVRGVEFYNRKEIRDVLAYLKVLVNPSDEVALLRIINTPARGIGKTTIDRVRGHAALNRITFLDALKRAEHIDSLGKAARAKIAVFVNMLKQLKNDVDGPVSALTKRVIVESGLERALEAGDIKDQAALENVDELISGAARYDEQTEEPSLVDYLQQISLFSDADAYDAANDRVAMMTLHSAKGLEFDNVFIVGLEDGILPHERSSDDEDDLEEERRLLFVGMTRARSVLYLSHARYRTIRGQMLRSIPSEFLYELGMDSAEVDYEEETTQDVQLFSPGDRVRHSSFGPGKVQEYIDMGENSIIVIKFNTGQTKSLLVK